MANVELRDKPPSVLVRPASHSEDVRQQLDAKAANRTPTQGWLARARLGRSQTQNAEPVVGSPLGRTAEMERLELAEEGPMGPDEDPPSVALSRRASDRPRYKPPSPRNTPLTKPLASLLVRSKAFEVCGKAATDRISTLTSCPFYIYFSFRNCFCIPVQFIFLILPVITSNCIYVN